LANKLSLDWQARVQADGVSSTLTFTAVTGPIAIFPPGSAAAAVTDLAQLTSLVPSAVTNLASGDGQTITATLLLGIVTVTWPIAPAAGQLFITGTWVF
jgi:hypothetical protein